MAGNYRYISEEQKRLVLTKASSVSVVNDIVFLLSTSFKWTELGVVLGVSAWPDQT